MDLDQVENLPYRKCVGIMLINDEGLVFAGQRIDGIAEAWQMPQGGIDKGEDTYSAALRELEEETGISAKLVEFVAESSGTFFYDLPEQLIPKLWGGKYRGQEQKWFLFRYLGKDNQININTRHPEFFKWRWMPMDQLIEKIVPFKKTVYGSVIAEFKDVFRSHNS